MIAGGDGSVDARSLRWQLVAVLRRGAAHPDPVRARAGTATPTRHTLYLLTLPVAVVLLARIPLSSRSGTSASTAAPTASEPNEGAGRSGSRSAGSSARDGRDGVRLRDPRPLARGLRRTPSASTSSSSPSVIVAIVGNAAEHGGAIVIARRGNTRARDRDRDLVVDAGRGVRRPGRRAALVARRRRPAARRSASSRSRRWRRRGVRDARRLGRHARGAGRASCSSASTRRRRRVLPRRSAPLGLEAAPASRVKA